MTDFVTRLEAQLHDAALRRERSGRLRGGALPRILVGLRDVPAAALATILLALAVAGAALMLSPSPERAAHGDPPAELRGVWRAPPTELRLYAAGSARCVNLGLGSSTACYTIGDASTRVAREWGTLTVSGRELTLRATAPSTPGVYRWRGEPGALRLTKVHDPVAARATALTAEAFAPAPRRPRRAEVPLGWTYMTFTSKRFGYSIRFPHPWKVNTSGPADRFSHSWSGDVVPRFSVAAQDLTPGTSAARWGAVVDSLSEARCAPHDFRRFFVGGMKVRVSVYRDCGAPNRQSASFVHDGRGYRVIWLGTAKRPESDYARFDAILETVWFSP